MVDFVRYQDVSARTRGQAQYAAFLLLPGQAVRRIELGPAGPIDQAVRAWRDNMEKWRPGTAAQQAEELEESDRLAALVRQHLHWERIALLLPSGTRLLLLAPDGDLTRFPFAALPAGVAGKILIEDYSVAYVPNAPFLLQRLLHAQEHGATRPSRFLAVGEVDYGARDRPFEPLPGSRAVIALAQRESTPRPMRALSHKAATVDALIRYLPTTSEAHLATHGSFDETRFNEEHERLVRSLRDWPRLGTPLGQVGAGRRFPLSFVYLALAGANEPALAGRAGGLLTGEAIPRLRLSGLRLVILDACDTGLGTFTAGEGVQNLQRAFHLAGCPNVVATLWHVKDEVCAALAEEFYQQRWHNQLPSLEALRQAQLTLYRNPGRLPFGTGTRGHPQLWGAAYVHSGLGDPFVLPAQLTEQLAHLKAEADHMPPGPGTDPTFAHRSLLWGGVGMVGVLALLTVTVARRRSRRRPGVSVLPEPSTTPPAGSDAGSTE